MTNYIAILIMAILSLSVNAQSIEKDKVYATQFLDKIFLEDQLHIKLKKIGRSTIHILESNDSNQVTRELIRLSDSTFLYTEYYPILSEQFIKQNRYRNISKEGVLVFSDETVVDSTEMWRPGTYENYPSPRLRNVYKQTGEWVEKHTNGSNKIIGSYNSNGKHGKWYHYNRRRELNKIVSYDNGVFVTEEFPNYLNHKSIEKTRETILNTWSFYKDKLSTNIGKHSSTYKFEPDGTFIYTFNRYVDGENTGYTKKGTWQIIDYKTVEFNLSNNKRTLHLEYLSKERIRIKE